MKKKNTKAAPKRGVPCKALLAAVKIRKVRIMDQKDVDSLLQRPVPNDNKEFDPIV